MNHIIGKPQSLKQVNLSLVRKAIKEKGSATRAEIVESTQVSITTVRTLLTEMLADGEIFEAGQDESVGGRKAVRYALNKNRFRGIAFCLYGDQVRYVKTNICGEICDTGSFPAGMDAVEAICTFLDRLVSEEEIRSIGIGVPGIVDGLDYRRMNDDGELETISVGGKIEERYRIPVILENDLNAITLGFGRCYLNEFEEEKCSDIHMAYIHFTEGCISAGFLAEGRILRGFRNFSGELGLFPVAESVRLDELMASGLDDRRYALLTAKMIAGVCCVLNPRYVAVGGESFRAECLPLINDSFYGMLPDSMAAEILYAKDKWQDYFSGMAYLTAEQIFSNIKLIRE